MKDHSSAVVEFTEAENGVPGPAKLLEFGDGYRQGLVPERFQAPETFAESPGCPGRPPWILAPEVLLVASALVESAAAAVVVAAVAFGVVGGVNSTGALAKHWDG